MMLARVAVRSTTRLSPSFVRIVLGGPELAGFGVAGPVLDQRIKLLLPGPTGLPQLRAESWWTDLQALPEDERGAVRTYTLRAISAEDETPEAVAAAIDRSMSRPAPDRSALDLEGARNSALILRRLLAGEQADQYR